MGNRLLADRFSLLLPELFCTPIDKSSRVRNDDPDILAPKSEMGLF